VWRLSDDRALVATVDVITPIVDDARTWGRIVATNAASDVYAMGARPLFGLSVVGWNSAALGDDVLVEALEGVAQAAADGGWLIVGGHSVDDPEPKLGVAVIGEVHPDRVLTKAGAQAGDALVLSKPIGVGIAVTALKQGSVSQLVLDAAVASMLRSNADAATIAVAAGAHAMTDVTGFGLLGHLKGLCDESGVDAVLDVAAVPVLDGLAPLVAAGAVPGGTGRNLAWVIPSLERGAVDDAGLAVLADPQTSGGLLMAVGRAAAEAVVAELRRTGHQAGVIGAVAAGSGLIRLA
jgi:selenide, water dikinase